MIYSLFTYCFYFFIFILFLMFLASYNLKKPRLNFIFYFIVSVLFSSFLVNLSTYSTVRSRPFNTSRLNDIKFFFCCLVFSFAFYFCFSHFLFFLFPSVQIEIPNCESGECICCDDKSVPTGGKRSNIS